MQNSILIIIFIALTSCSYRSSNDLESMNLYGKIKSIHEEKRDSNNDLIMTKQTHFTNSGMVESIEFNYPQKHFSNKTIHHYNHRNKLTKQEYITNDSLMLIQEYLQINLNKDSLFSYTSNRELINTTIIEYNNDKQVIELKAYDLQMELTYSEISKYDENSRLKETKVKSLDSTINGDIYSYSYDSLGRIQTFTVNNSINDFESQEIYSYEADKLGNWIKKHIMSEGEMISIVTRKIEYK